MATNFASFIHRLTYRICLSVVLSTELIRWTHETSGAAGSRVQRFDKRVYVPICQLLYL